MEEVDRQAKISKRVKYSTLISLDKKKHVSTVMDSTSSTSPITTTSASHSHHQQQIISLDAPDEDDLGGNSNSNSNSLSSGRSETDFPHEHLMMDSSISSPTNKLASSPSPFHDPAGSGGEEQQLLHTTANSHSRANFSQFETPADETRNNFGPDDFDEQLFIGQLGTNCTEETRRFDEELEPQVIMDTADHSESSDVEDLYPSNSSSSHNNHDKPPAQPEVKTYTQSSNRTGIVGPPGPPDLMFFAQRRSEVLVRRRVKPDVPSIVVCALEARRRAALRQRQMEEEDDEEEKKEVPSPQGELVPIKVERENDIEHLNEDLSCDNALDTESIEEHDNHHHRHHHRIPIRLSFTNSAAEDEGADKEQSTSRSCISADGLKSSPMRKRKGEMAVDSPDESLPLKKPVTDDDVDDFSGLSGIMVENGEDGDQQMDSPEEDDLGREEVYEERPEGSPYSCNIEESVGEACSSVPSGSSVRSIIPSKAHPPPRLGEWLQIFTGWSHPERLMAITELIGICEATQVRHMMQIIEPQFQRDFISLLPKELALYVLSFLDPRDLLRAAQTCKYWRILADDNLLWREKCKEAGIGYFSAMSNRVHRRSRNNTNAHNSTASNSDVPNTRWKAAFMKQHYVEMNWKRKDTRDHKILKGHDDHVITCLQFSGNRIVSGSDDNTLKVWSANTGKCLRTLLGHTGSVWSSQMSGTTIVSGSTDRTLRVWNAETGQCLHTLYGHTSTVRCMHLHGKKVVSGSRDATLRMWDVETGECLHVLVGHMAAVRCVQYNGHLVVSGAYDYMVRIWDTEREECLHQLSGHTNRVYSLQFDGIHVVSGSLDTSIRVWDVESGACKHTLMGHQSLTSGMELRDNLLVSGNADSTVKIWDISTGQCLLTLTGPNKHLSAVTCLQLINKFVITSSDDGTVKLWDIRSGDFVRNLVSLSSGGSGGVVWRIRASETKLVCAVGSRNGTEETKLLVLDFDTDPVKPEPKVEVKTEIQLDY